MYSSHGYGCAIVIFGIIMLENNPNYGTIQCKSKFIRLTADEEKACKGRNSFPSVNENKWVNKFIKGGKR